VLARHSGRDAARPIRRNGLARVGGAKANDADVAPVCAGCDADIGRDSRPVFPPHVRTAQRPAIGLQPVAFTCDAASDAGSTTRRRRGRGRTSPCLLSSRFGTQHCPRRAPSGQSSQRPLRCCLCTQSRAHTVERLTTQGDTAIVASLLSRQARWTSTRLQRKLSSFPSVPLMTPSRGTLASTPRWRQFALGARARPSVRAADVPPARSLPRTMSGRHARSRIEGRVCATAWTRNREPPRSAQSEPSGRGPNAASTRHRNTPASWAAGLQGIGSLDGDCVQSSWNRRGHLRLAPRHVNTSLGSTGLTMSGWSWAASSNWPGWRLNRTAPSSP